MARVVFLVFFGVAGCGILVWLGAWQVQRLAWKESVLAEIDSRISAEPAPLPTTPDPDTDKYLPVQVSGTIADGELHVLVSVKHVGPGYRIIAPFQTEDGRLILLDRGFVATEEKEELRHTGPATVVGNLHWPDEIDGFTPEPDVAANTWFARDVAQMAAALDTEPVLLIARSRTDPAITPLPVDTVGIPNDHLQYAITWFSLALIWAAMTAYFLWRTRANSESEGT